MSKSLPLNFSLVPIKVKQPAARLSHAPDARSSKIRLHRAPVPISAYTGSKLYCPWPSAVAAVAPSFCASACPGTLYHRKKHSPPERKTNFRLKPRSVLAKTEAGQLRV